MIDYAGEVNRNFLLPGMEIISKPFNMDALAVQVREMLRQTGQ